MYVIYISAGVFGLLFSVLGCSLIWSCKQHHRQKKPRNDIYKDNFNDTGRELKDLEISGNVLNNDETMIKFFAININGDPKIEYTLKVIPPDNTK